MDGNIVFTVFTPTYNRAHTLPKLFASLQQQTFEEFEWVVVDDGSTDDTEDKIKTWQRESKFPLRYFKQENTGKPSAINRGVKEAAGELFLSIDSDDRLLPSALETFWHHWTEIPEEKRQNFAGVGGLAADKTGEIIGTKYPESPLDSEPVKLYYQQRVKGDKKWFVKTEIMEQFPFPQLDGENFIPDSIVWFRIGEEWNFRLVNEIVCIKDYLSDGITHSWLRTALANPRGFRLRMQELVRRERDISVPLLKKLSHWGHYWRFSLHSQVDLSSIIHEAPAQSIFLPLSAPIGFLRYYADRIRALQWDTEET